MHAAMKAGRPAFIEALRSPAVYAHEVAAIEIVETHISWVVLTGQYAYKIKKPLNLGFLDFSTLALREHACREELRLNARLAPEIYVGVVALTGDESRPRIGGPGDAFEYAVKMRQFPGEEQLDRLLDAGRLDGTDIESAARRIAAFHCAAPAEVPAGYGTVEAVLKPVLENFRQIHPRLEEKGRLTLDELESWSLARAAELEPVFSQRRAEGRVRECHGDLHLANLVRLGAQVVPFDCIEFDPALRWIDVVSDLAFLIMDLHYRDRPDLAYRCLNAWLSETGDYACMSVLRFYLVYRALVRTKVALIRAQQADTSEAEHARANANDYLALAHRLTQSRKPALILMHGLSGSGKTTVSSALLAALGCIRLRSDVERKRLAGIDSRTSARTTPGSGIYAPEMSGRTYAHLLRVAESIVRAGESVIVDAAFLRASQRAPFVELAVRVGAPLVLVECVSELSELERRLTRRSIKGRDASDADIRVLRAQEKAWEPVAESEHIDMCKISSEEPARLQVLIAALRARMGAASGEYPA